MTKIDEDELELQDLVDKGFQGCAIDGCRGGIDSRGKVKVRGIAYPVCSAHFEAIFGVIGRQDDVEYEEEEYAVGEVEVGAVLIAGNTVTWSTGFESSDDSESSWGITPTSPEYMEDDEESARFEKGYKLLQSEEDDR